MADVSSTHPAAQIWALPGLAAFRANVLNRPIESINTGWEDTLIPLGLVLAGREFGDAAMLDWAERWADYHLAVPVQNPPLETLRNQHSGDPTRGVYLTPYCGEWGCAMVFAELHALRPADRLLAMTRRVADHIIDGSIRVGSGPGKGVIGHGHWSKIPWVDTLYYSSSPLALAYRITGEARYAREAVQQCLLHAHYLRDERTGVWFHEADLETGQHTNGYWARGNGWVIMALADTLRDCPRDTPGWEDVLAIYRSMVTGLLRLQHPCGLWRIVPENEESHLETSGSIMIATGITLGIVAGWINASTAFSVSRTWNEVLTWIDRQGRLMGCQTPAGHGGWEVHKLSQMGERTYATGTLLRLAAEMRKAGLL